MKRERRHALEAAAAAVVSAIVRRLPRRLVLAVGRGLGRVWAALDRRHLKIAADNLRRAFPEWDEALVQATARGVYAHFAEVLLEILWMEGRPPAELLALTEVEGLEHLKRALARGRGVVSPIAHLGNWELQGVATPPLIGPSAVKKVLQGLRASFDLVVVDCPSTFNEPTLAVLDEADLILTLLTLEITSVKNMRLFLEVTEQLGYGPEKIRLVLNRADSTLGIRVADVEHSIGRKVDHTIVSDGRSVVYALNRGVPFFLSNREAQVSQDIQRLAVAITGSSPTAVVARPGDKAGKGAAKNKSLFAWR